MVKNKNLIKWMEQVALKVFNIAQSNAPTKSGELKNSGSYKVINKGNDVGFQIEYTAPHAYALHEGKAQGEMITDIDPSKFPWKADTRRHKRKLPTKTVWVRRHVKTYKKMYKPTKINDEWKAIDYKASSDIKAQRWIQKAWDTFLKRQDKLTRSVLPKKITIG